jgi:hypothetical protein
MEAPGESVGGRLGFSLVFPVLSCRPGLSPACTALPFLISKVEVNVYLVVELCFKDKRDTWELGLAFCTG